MRSGQSTPLTLLSATTSPSIHKTISLNRSNPYMLEMPPQMQPQLQPQLQALIHSAQEPTYILETDPSQLHQHQQHQHDHEHDHTASFHVRPHQFKGPNNQLISKFRKW